MIRYAFPQIIEDACTFGVLPVLMEAISQTYHDAMEVNAAQADVERILAHRATPMPPLGVSSVGLDLSGLTFDDVLYLLFRQEYTGFDYDAEAPLGVLPLLSEAYDLSEEDLSALWMSWHIYKTSQEAVSAQSEPSVQGEAAADVPTPEGQPLVHAPEEEVFSTWTDERALDLLKAAISPFGNDVDAFFAPFTTALEVQTDLVRADHGDPDSMIELAYDLILGKGVEVDYEQAQRWAELASQSETHRAEEAAIMAQFLALLRDHEAQD